MTKNPSEANLGCCKRIFDVTGGKVSSSVRLGFELIIDCENQIYGLVRDFPLAARQFKALKLSQVT
jgi:hypothetical protein